MSLSKRTRFEVLKRDGFRCKYCGASSLSTLLHVDHVIPRAEGGPDDPANLVTACAPCNLGKSAVSLEESRLPQVTPEQLAEQAEQVRAYMAAVRELEEQRREFAEMLVDIFERDSGLVCPPDIASRVARIVEEHGIEGFGAAARAIAEQRWQLHTNTQVTKYFYGCLRRRKEGGGR